jgi:hypothetical protein
VFMMAAEQVASEMNAWAHSFFGRPIIHDWRAPSRGLMPFGPRGIVRIPPGGVPRRARRRRPPPTRYRR